ESLLSRLEEQLRADAAAAARSGDAQAWESLRVRWLGRRQGVIGLMSENWLRTAPPELKRVIGQRLNALRVAAERQVEEGASAAARKSAVSAAKASTASDLFHPAAAERLDVTLPGNVQPTGVRHPLHRVIDDITAIFLALGYSV